MACSGRRYAMIREHIIRNLSAKGMIAVNTVLLTMAIPPILSPGKDRFVASNCDQDRF